MTKTELFRRRIAPVLFGVVIALMARKSCHEQERARATFVLDLGEAKADTVGVDCELWMGGELVANLHRHALEGHTIGTPQFEATLPANDGELRLDVQLRYSVPHVVFTQRVHADDGATVTVKLGPHLGVGPGSAAPASAP